MVKILLKYEALRATLLSAAGAQTGKIMTFGYECYKFGPCSHRLLFQSLSAAALSPRKRCTVTV